MAYFASASGKETAPALDTIWGRREGRLCASRVIEKKRIPKTRPVATCFRPLQWPNLKSAG